MRSAVDAVHDHEELVVKPAAPAVMAAGLYAGTTLADDGRPILLLDPSGMAKCAGRRLRARPRSNGASRRRPSPRRRRQRDRRCCCSATLDGGRRAVPVAAGRADRGRRPPTAIGFSAGRLRVALGRAASCRSPAAPPRRRPSKLRILRLTDGDTEIAYGFAEVIDIRALVLDLQPAPAPGEVAGVFLVDGAPGRIARSALAVRRCTPTPRTRTRQPVCALPAGRSLDRQYAAAADREPRLPHRQAPATPADIADRAARTRRSPQDANVVRLRARRREGRGQHLSLRPRRLDRRARRREGSAAMAELLLIARLAGAPHRLSRRRRRGGGRARGADPGAARRAARRRPVGAAEPRADRDRRPRRARGRPRRRPRPATRSSSRRAAILMPCSSRGRGRDRGLDARRCPPRPRWARAGTGSRSAWSKPRASCFCSSIRTR